MPGGGNVDAFLEESSFSSFLDTEVGRFESLLKQSGRWGGEEYEVKVKSRTVPMLSCTGLYILVYYV
jgi:hypothetical protein